MTTSLHVDFLHLTPVGVPVEVRGRVKEIKGRKVLVAATLSAEGEACARGEVVAVHTPEHMTSGEAVSYAALAANRPSTVPGLHLSLRLVSREPSRVPNGSALSRDASASLAKLDVSSIW